MKAAVLHANGDLRYEEYETPEIKAGTVKVRIRATGICGSDVPRVLHNGAHYFATEQLKFDKDLIFKTYPMSKAAEAFAHYKNPSRVHGKIMLVNE